MKLSVIIGIYKGVIEEVEVVPVDKAEAKMDEVCDSFEIKDRYEERDGYTIYDNPDMPEIEVHRYDKEIGGGG